tara:strand:+ start:17581 stop:18900 length:1320 start_codon:yes stop_codon:yes gene_type:complete
MRGYTFYVSLLLCMGTLLIGGCPGRIGNPWLFEKPNEHITTPNERTTPPNEQTKEVATEARVEPFIDEKPVASEPIRDILPERRAEPLPEPTNNEPPSEQLVETFPEPSVKEEPFVEPVKESIPEPVPEPIKESPPQPLNKPVWIGVGNYGLRSWTRDGKTWNQLGGNANGQTNPHTPDLLRNIAYGDGVFVAVGGHKNSGIQRTEDGGKTWTDVGFATGGWLGGVTYHNGVWFTGNGYSGEIMRSTDKGKTWKATDRTKSEITNRGAGIRGMTAFNNKVIAHGDSGALYVSSDNGISWKDMTIPNLKYSLGFVTYYKGLWAAGGRSYDNATKSFITGCKVSNDLKTWKDCPFTLPDVFTGSVGNGLMAVFSGSKYAYTTDGKTWKTGTSKIHTAFFLDKLWVAKRYGAALYGPTLDNLTQIAGNNHGNFRGFAAGLTR